jgi:hypothetical protein
MKEEEKLLLNLISCSWPNEGTFPCLFSLLFFVSSRAQCGQISKLLWPLKSSLLFFVLHHFLNNKCSQTFASTVSLSLSLSLSLFARYCDTNFSFPSPGKKEREREKIAIIMIVFRIFHSPPLPEERFTKRASSGEPSENLYI